MIKGLTKMINDKKGAIKEEATSVFSNNLAKHHTDKPRKQSAKQLEISK